MIYRVSTCFNHYPQYFAFVPRAHDEHGQDIHGRFHSPKKQRKSDGLSSNGYNISDWWCGTFKSFVYDFSYIGNVIIPTDELVFFRGVDTTNQICTYIYICIKNIIYIYTYTYVWISPLKTETTCEADTIMAFAVATWLEWEWRILPFPTCQVRVPCQTSQRISEEIFDRMPERMSKDVPECQNICQIECQI